MAVEVLTSISAKVSPEHCHITLFGEQDLESWETMPPNLTTQSSTGTGTDFSSQGASYSEASSSGDGMPPPPAGAAPSSKKRKPSKPKLPSADLRRAASTPQIRGLSQTESSPLESPTSDKRRNKLGYHRTSVACGHCRRRKIRCLLAPEDPHGRCLNCIRLKKDCHFYPVDQGPADPKSRPTGSADKGLKPHSNSNHSSPRTSAASDSVEDPMKSQNLSTQEPFSIHSSKQSSELDFSGSPLDGAPFQSPTFSYQGMPDSSHWGGTSFYGNQTLTEDPNTPQSATEFWPQQHAPGSAIFQHRGSIPIGLEQPNFYAPPNEPTHNWGAMRSMSVGHASAMPDLHQFQQQFRHTYQTSPYPYTFTDGSNSSLPIAAPEQEPTMSSSVPHILPSQGFPQGWTPFTSADQPTPVVEQPQEMYGAPWYTEPGAMSTIDETLPTTTATSFPTSHPGQ